MRGIGAFVGGTLFVVAIFAGWWAIDRAQEHLPGPINAVIDSVQNGGMPGAGPIVQPLPDTGPGDPLEGCPEFAEDARAAEEAFLAVAGDGLEDAEAGNAIIDREVTRVAGGGEALPLSSTGVDSALTAQATSLDALAGQLRSTTMQTPQARALVAGIAAAADRLAAANRRLVGQAAGTPQQWQEWSEAVTGPGAQMLVATRAFGKCPA